MSLELVETNELFWNWFWLYASGNDEDSVLLCELKKVIHLSDDLLLLVLFVFICVKKLIYIFKYDYAWLSLYLFA